MRLSSPLNALCPVFGACGGCATQHLSERERLNDHRARLEHVFEAAGVTAPSLELPIVAYGMGRRRITLHAERQGALWNIGFRGKRSHILVPITHCPVSDPALFDAVPLLQRLLGETSKIDAVSALLTVTETGIDIAITADKDLSEKNRLSLTQQASCEPSVARLTWNEQLVALIRMPLVHLGTIAVELPIQAFLQATKVGEETLQGLVCDGVGKGRVIADLFSGCGTFSFALAALKSVKQVMAVDASETSLAALQKAARFASGLKPIRTEIRDLFRRPFLASELKAFDTVVLDPPRAGAAEQVSHLVSAKNIQTVVMVSCAPQTFARDAKTLIEGGYSWTHFAAVDQFQFTEHLEVVAVFSR
jgi:23S rRNA (uracil1939-C5)-methyltransferase